MKEIVPNWIHPKTKEKIDTLIENLPEEDRKLAIRYLNDAQTDGALNTAIGKIFNLEDCADAHDATLEPGRTGSVLIKVKD